MRVITNQIEKFTALALKNGASRAVGTAGTTPFATDFKILPSLRKVLVDNGCPVEDGELALVLNSTAGANLRGLAQLNRVNEAGGDQMLRRGELLNLNGFSLKESAGIPQHVAGTGANYVTSGTGAIGDKSLTLATGTGTILAGDIVSVANSDGSLYVVNSPIAAPGVLGIAAPGLTGATATAKAVTVGAGYTGNVGFHKSAVEIVMRPPAMPPGGDIAVDRTTIFDAVSGLVFEVAEYKGRGMNLFEITTFYGAKVWKPEYVATLLG